MRGPLRDGHATPMSQGVGDLLKEGRPDVGRRIAGIPLVDVYRGSLIESVHSVAVSVCGPDGEALLQLGDVDSPVFLRSLAKPFIAAEVVRSGAAAAYGITSEEIATIAGSHDGEDCHVTAVRSILTRIRLTEDALACGPAIYERSEEPPIRNNCSGKHAGVLALCLHWGYDVRGYTDLWHPVQRRLFETVVQFFDIDQLYGADFAVDGCTMPIFAASLRRIAMGFARLADPTKLEETLAGGVTTVLGAITAHPDFVGGTNGNFDTEIARASHGNIIGKLGAEGMYGVAVRSRRIGVALKVIDGNSRALPPILLGCLRHLDALPLDTAQSLHQFFQPPIRNAVGNVVGRVSARAF
jgi:L-asparaginase II